MYVCTLQRTNPCIYVHNCSSHHTLFPLVSSCGICVGSVDMRVHTYTALTFSLTVANHCMYVCIYCVHTHIYCV